MKRGVMIMIKNAKHGEWVKDLPDDIYNAFVRANCMFYDDIVKQERHFISRNKKRPLADYEKERIKRYFAMKDPYFEIIFHN